MLKDPNDIGLCMCSRFVAFLFLKENVL